MNAVSFYAVSLYASNMTGNVSAIAIQIARSDIWSAARYAAIVAVFMLGAAGSVIMLNAGRRRGIVGIYALSILAEGILLAMLAGLDINVPRPGQGSLLAFGLSFLMGLQNAVATRISDARVRTTHVTGMVTDIAIELGNLVDLVRRRQWYGDDRGVTFSREKLQLYGLTVLSFLVGGMLGVLAYIEWGAYFLFVAAALLLLLAFANLIKVRGR